METRRTRPTRKVRPERGGEVARVWIRSSNAPTKAAGRATQELSICKDSNSPVPCLASLLGHPAARLFPARFAFGFGLHTLD